MACGNYEQRTLIIRKAVTLLRNPSGRMRHSGGDPTSTGTGVASCSQPSFERRRYGERRVTRFLVFGRRHFVRVAL